MINTPCLTIHMTDLFWMMTNSPSGTCLSSKCTSQQRRKKKTRQSVKCWKSVSDLKRKGSYLQKGSGMY